MTSDFISNFKQKFIHLFSDIDSDVLAAVNALAATIIDNGGSVLIQAATDAVQVAEQTGGTGPQKFALALTSVITTMEGKGVTIVMNAINAAIEAAVAQQKLNTQENTK